MLLSNLKTTEYNQDYYDEHKDAGLDYLGHGYWQEEYAKMVIEACKTPRDAFVVDAGCACGSILKGFQKQNMRVLGVDLNPHMIDIGKPHFGFYANELHCGSISDTPALTESVDLVHTAQVLEHIPEEHMDSILQELSRIIKKTGRVFVCLDAIKDGETILMEVKRDAKAKFTKDQLKFIANWKGGPLSRVDSSEAALRAIGLIRVSDQS